MGIILGNILSFIGGLLDFVFDLKYNEKLKILQGNFISSALSLVAYVCLNAYDGVINCVVTILRLITIYFKDKYHKKCHFLFVVFFALYCTVFFDYSGIQTIILFLSSICAFVPKWVSKDMQKIRIGGVCANILMIIYNVMISNYAVILIQILNIIFLIITLTKWSKKRASSAWRKREDSH